MTTLQAVLLGTVQGLGEFLPISSSAHLVIMPWLFRFPDPGLAFDVALHLGTLLALLSFFYRDWVHLTGAFFRSLRKRPTAYNFEERLIWFLILATIPGAVFGYLIEDYAETILRGPLLIAMMMAVMGIILGLADRFGAKTKKLEQITLKDSLLVGVSQALALIPGTSRSGVTISTGLFLQMDRRSAARFSFLLSTPITAGACLVKMKDLFRNHFDFNAFLGILVSAVVGYFAIKYMLYFLQRYTYRVYVIYRLAFAAMIVAVWLSRR
ncbi:MAG TPA: undecaprenyl-diphosphatase UppP [Deltaproteobacteria bacterium]|nr:undecaprenyl-diphosphatase UppP [Deltaproteobacteria bacterium]